MMFPLPFLKKKEDEVKKVYIPVDLVLNFAARGMSESEIVSQLKAQGFEDQYIDRALRIALKEKINPEHFRRVPETRMPAAAPGPGYTMATPLGLEPPQPMFEEVPPVAPQITRRPSQAAPIGIPPERMVSPIREPVELNTEEAREPAFTFEEGRPETLPVSPEEITIEELIEGIIEERWKNFEDRLIDFEKRDILLENEIEDLRKGLKQIEGAVVQREKSLISKLDEFGGSVDNIEGRIGSIEKVFKDFLPELTQNIKTMSDLVEKIREEKK